MRRRNMQAFLLFNISQVHSTRLVTLYSLLIPKHLIFPINLKTLFKNPISLFQFQFLFCFIKF